MLVFLHEFVFALGLLLLFGLCGAGAVASFVSKLRYGYLSAPLAGLLLVTLGSLAFYVILGLGFRYAAALAILACASTSVARHWSARSRWAQLSWGQLVGQVAAPIVLVGALVLTVDAATLSAGGLAFSYGDGTDHGGYAQIADWLLAHGPKPPVATETLPYQSWPALMAAADPRFGSFGLLAIIAWLHQSSGLFAYDIACTVVLAAAILGVAAVFSQNRWQFLLLLVGLSLSGWFEYSRCGFFGKLISYPCALFVAGLIFASWRAWSNEHIFFIALLAASAGLMHSGTGFAVLLAAILGAAFVPAFLASRKSSQDLIWVGGLAILLPPVASGIFARPLPTGFPNFGVSWPYALPRILDLDNQGVAVTGLTESFVTLLAAIALISWLLFIGWSIWARNIAALGLTAGPAVMLGFLALRNQPAPAFQMIGYFYPAVLCGAVQLATDLSARSIGLVAAVVVAIALREPRFAGDLARYAWSDVPSRYTAAELDTLARDIGNDAVEIDVREPQPGIVLLDELGRRQLHLMWSAAGWKTVLGYRKWPPVPPVAPVKRLRSRLHPTMRAHFWLSPADAPDIDESVAEAPVAISLSPEKPVPPDKPLPPGEVARFPEGLLAPNLYFSGVSQDGWLGPKAVTRLSIVPSSDMLHLTGEISDFSPLIATGTMRISVDDIPVLTRPETIGPFDLTVPIPAAAGQRSIAIELTGADRLPPPDGRLVSIRLTSIALKHSGGQDGGGGL